VADGQSVYRSKPILKPGVYTLNIGQANIPIAVNVPAEEADIRNLPFEEIRKRLGDIEMTNYGDSLPAEALSRDEGNDLGWSVMTIVLILVGAECYMAMRFGHYRRPGRKATVASAAAAA